MIRAWTISSQTPSTSAASRIACRSAAEGTKSSIDAEDGASRRRADRVGGNTVFMIMLGLAFLTLAVFVYWPLFRGRAGSRVAEEEVGP